MLKAHTAPDTPPAAKMKLKQHVLLRMAELLVKGGSLDEKQLQRTGSFRGDINESLQLVQWFSSLSPKTFQKRIHTYIAKRTSK